MCKSKITPATESGVLAAIRVLETELGMTTAEFRERYAAGELDHLFIFNHWDQLLDLLSMLRREGDDAAIVAQTREFLALDPR